MVAMERVGLRVGLIGLVIILLAPVCLGQNVPVDRVNFSMQAPQAVSAVATTVTGTAGSTTYYYWVVANYPGGSVMPVRSARITNAPNTLDGVNYVNIYWQATQSATNYTVLRTTLPATPSGVCAACVVGTVSGTTTTDQGAALTALSVTIKRAAQGWLGINNTGYTAYLESNIPISTGVGVNVKQYGVVGDGATNDTAAIQAALTANVGKTLVFPCGTYKFNAITLDGDGYTLTGMGNCTIFDTALDTGNWITFQKSGGAIGTRNTIKNLAIITTSNAVPTSRTNVYIVEQNSFVFQNVFMYYGYIGIHQIGGNSFSQKYLS